MAVYLVTWDLNGEKDYTKARAKVITHLERYAHVKDPGLDSVWFLSTDWSPQQIYTDLKLVFDDNDRFAIVQMYKNTGHSGWLHKDVWSWIQARL